MKTQKGSNMCSKFLTCFGTSSAQTFKDYTYTKCQSRQQGTVDYDLTHKAIGIKLGKLQITTFFICLQDRSAHQQYSHRSNHCSCMEQWAALKCLNCHPYMYCPCSGFHSCWLTRA